MDDLASILAESSDEELVDEATQWASEAAELEESLQEGDGLREGPGAGGAPDAAATAAASRALLLQRVTRLYAFVDMHKSPAVLRQIVDKYAGRQHELWARLRGKYPEAASIVLGEQGVAANPAVRSSSSARSSAPGGNGVGGGACAGGAGKKTAAVEAAEGRLASQPGLAASAATICARLNEEKQGLVRRALALVGDAVGTQLLRRTLDIEASGGVLIAGETRRRSAGGVFMSLVKQEACVDPACWRWLYAEERAAKKAALKARSVAKDARRRREAAVEADAAAPRPQRANRPGSGRSRPSGRNRNPGGGSFAAAGGGWGSALQTQRHGGRADGKGGKGGGKVTRARGRPRHRPY